MASRIGRLGTWVVVAALTLAAEPGHAGKKADAQKHFQAGKALMKTEDFKGAMVEFETSVELFPTKNGLFNLGNCYKALHRYGDALAVFQRLEREHGARLDREMRTAVARHVAEIESLVAELVLEVEPDGARVVVDGREVGPSPVDGPLVLGPGEHVLEVTLADHEPVERTLRIVSGVRQVERVKLDPIAAPEPEPPVAVAPAPVVVEEPPAAPAPPVAASADDADAEAATPAATPSEPPPPDLVADESPLSGLFWVGLGGTLAFGATAGVFWATTEKEYGRFEDQRDDYQLVLDDPQATPEQEQEAYDSAHDQAENVEFNRAMAIGFSVGGGLFLIGTLIVLGVDLSGDETDVVEVAATPGGVTLSF